MSKDDRNQPAISPTESLDSLPKLVFEPERTDQESDLRRAELLQSVLAIAGMNHVSESQLVRAVVKNALGRVPEIGE
jgi:hypothetical protein